MALNAGGLFLDEQKLDAHYTGVPRDLSDLQKPSVTHASKRKPSQEISRFLKKNPCEEKNTTKQSVVADSCVEECSKKETGVAEPRVEEKTTKQKHVVSESCVEECSSKETVAVEPRVEEKTAKRKHVVVEDPLYDPDDVMLRPDGFSHFDRRVDMLGYLKTYKLLHGYSKKQESPFIPMPSDDKLKQWIKSWQ